MLKWLLLAGLIFCPDAFALDQAQLATILEEAREELEMPGVRAAFRTADGNIVTAAVGLADKEAGIPLDNRVGMPGGSTGKPFVATLTMLLVEDGTLSPDDLASKWLSHTSWFRELPNSDTIRVRHLLSHSSGLSDYPGTAGFMFKMVWRVLRHGSAYFEPEELIGLVAGRDPLFPAGQGYKYTDAGYLVLGLLIEEASGRSYYDLLEERILQPLQLDAVKPAIQSALPGITPGYTGGARNLKKDGRMKFDPRSEWTGGGLVTNPTMLVEFFAALAEGRVLSDRSFRQMLSGGWHNPETPEWHYGFGLFVNDKERSFAHGGMWPGYRTYVTHNLETGVTVAVQANRDGRLDLKPLAARLAKE